MRLLQLHVGSGGEGQGCRCPREGAETPWEAGAVIRALHRVVAMEAVLSGPVPDVI